MSDEKTKPLEFHPFVKFDTEKHFLRDGSGNLVGYQAVNINANYLMETAALKVNDRVSLLKVSSTESMKIDGLISDSDEIKSVHISMIYATDGKMIFGVITGTTNWLELKQAFNGGNPVFLGTFNDPEYPMLGTLDWWIDQSTGNVETTVSGGEGDFRILGYKPVFTRGSAS